LHPAPRNGSARRPPRWWRRLWCWCAIHLGVACDTGPLPPHRPHASSASAHRKRRRSASADPCHRPPRALPFRYPVM
jgi:hypothetical protein